MNSPGLTETSSVSCASLGLFRSDPDNLIQILLPSTRASALHQYIRGQLCYGLDVAKRFVLFGASEG